MITSSSHLTTNLRGIHNARIFASTSNLVFMAQCLRFGWKRCSPLNWATCEIGRYGSGSN